MTELNSEGRRVAQTICVLLYLFGGFFIGAHFLFAHWHDKATPEWVAAEYGTPEPLSLYIGGSLLFLAVLLHVIFALRYRGEFNNRAVFADAATFVGISGALMGVPLLLAQTSLPPQAIRWLYASLIKAMVGQPPFLALAGLSLLVMRRSRSRPAYLLLTGLPAALRQEPTAQPQNKSDVW